MIGQYEHLRKYKKEKRRLNIMSKIRLVRYDTDKNSVFGMLNIHLDNGISAHFNTVESKERKLKEGKYQIYMGYSPKFDCNLWSLHTIDRSGIRIHAANSGRELEGCIALGLYRKEGLILRSREAIEVLNRVLSRDKTYELEII